MEVAKIMALVVIARMIITSIVMEGMCNMESGRENLD